MRITSFFRGLATTASVATLAVLLAGCQTGRQVDWNSRVGAYTFSQAVLDMGPPDKQARLDDGTVVGDWETRRGQVITTFAGGYHGRHGHPVGVAPVAIMSVSPTHYLRLTFGPDGRLVAWRRGAL